MQRTVCLVVLLKVISLCSLAFALAWNSRIQALSPPVDEMAARSLEEDLPKLPIAESSPELIRGIQDQLARISLEQFQIRNEIERLEQSEKALTEREFQARLELESEFQDYESIRMQREQLRQQALENQGVSDLPTEYLRIQLEEELRSLEEKRDDFKREEKPLVERVLFLNSLNFQTDELPQLEKRIQSVRQGLQETQVQIEEVQLRYRTENQRAVDARDWNLSQQREQQSRQLESLWSEARRKYAAFVNELAKIELDHESQRKKLEELRQQERDAERQIQELETRREQAMKSRNSTVLNHLPR